jgi:para-aminobenzoate synthetase/4-amino-4-deoxychorismate lyase
MESASINNRILIHDQISGKWLRFSKPDQIITTKTISEIQEKLSQIEHFTQIEGYHAAGFISYEAARAFDHSFKTHTSNLFPLLWFGLYKKPETVMSLDKLQPDNQKYLIDWQASLDRSEYDRALTQIHRYIEIGDTYQVNFTYRLFSDFNADPYSLFFQMIQAQKPRYGAYIDTNEFAVCCASPELFFQLNNNQIISRPMKGTAPRGRTLEEDEQIAQKLKGSAKNRAENLMVVDMIRNDLGKIADIGSVTVNELFTLERYPTLWQLVSSVHAHANADFKGIINALFPCASITGPPKPRTMEIIHELESTPRNIYTGTIGFLAPGRKAQFNVAIRTVLVDKIEKRAEFGIGGGIVWDSTANDEYEECLTKALMISEVRPSFSLLETILWEPKEGYFLLNEHLQRLENSANYFDIKLNLEEINSKLFEFDKLNHEESTVIRLLIDQAGQITIEQIEFPSNHKKRYSILKFARRPIDKMDTWLYHKTDYRKVYQNALSSVTGCDDVVLWNEDGEITETTRANIVILKDEKYFTPPVTSGLLAGTFRSWLIEKDNIMEETISKKMLENAEEIYIINSVRKWQKCTLSKD